MNKWWQTGIIYQVYPRSFQDSSGNGIGDIVGITNRLDYLAWLGVDAVWISPIYPSPMHDFGYDVSNYVDVHPLFGSLADIDALIEKAHQLGLKIILDFVPNHTSIEHDWFIESRQSRESEKRDWYIWQDAAEDGGPPNNWLSLFGGKSAWEWDETTQQYYLHLFLKEQPDLNWRNPDVKEAMLNFIRFWFDRGVDGFRVDVSDRVMKDPAWRDNPPNPDWQPTDDPFYRLKDIYTHNYKDIHIFNRWMRAVADEYDERVMIGETYLSPADLVDHYGDNDEFHLPFNFHLVECDWDLETIRGIVEKYEAVLPPDKWPNWVLGNHDRHRVATRAGAGQAKLAMMLLLTLRGTPTIYYGDELGIENVDIPPEKEVDPWGILSPGLGLGRDQERTPMQWDGSAHAGFCDQESEPWLPLSDDFAIRNVAAMQKDPTSILAMTKNLIALRRATSALTIGAYQTCPSPQNLYVYQRQSAESTCVILLNFGTTEQTYRFEKGSYSVALTTQMDDVTISLDGELLIRPNEGIICIKVS